MKLVTRSTRARSKKPREIRAKQRGQSTIEYTVVCAALAFALGVGMVDKSSVLWQLIDGFKTAYHKISYAISVPT